MNNTFGIEFTLFAEADLDEIALYIAEHDDVNKAVQVYLKIKKKILSLAEFPDQGRIVPELKRIRLLDYREIIFNPYRIIYLVKDRTVFIIAVFDGRREIGDILYDRITV
ncbi:MAG TPA: type II toxin-antitoxin system RelE/ParE family toxin [Candidatus Kapabacteria bacterium]|nr:type II toxin-antitoxin system RelE/ParE family toxin [Candidatus Kapabacteria bacterium]